MSINDHQVRSHGQKSHVNWGGQTNHINWDALDHASHAPQLMLRNYYYFVL